MLISLIASVVFAIHALITKKKSSWRKAGYSFLGIFIFSFIATGFKPPAEKSVANAVNSNNINPENTIPHFTEEDKETGWVGTPSKMLETCQGIVAEKYGKSARFSSEGKPIIQSDKGKYIMSGFIENGKDFTDVDCISTAQNQYEIAKIKPPTPVAPVVEKPQTVADKILALGKNPNKDVIETDDDNGRHHYLWNRPDLGEEVSSAWYSQNDWWIKIRKPTFTRQDLSTGMKFNRSNGVADSYVITSGPLKSGFYTESATQVNIYSDAPRWHELNNY